MKPLLLVCLIAALLAACAGPAAPSSAPPSSDSGRVTLTTQPRQQPPTSRSQPTAAPQPQSKAPARAELVTARIPRLQPGGRTRTTPLVGGLNRFTFDLYHTALKGQDDNLIYSPYSIALAFSMVYAGARGKTEAQMAKVLGFLPQERHHPAANALERHLASLGTKAPSTGEEQGEAFRLRSANAVWGQRGFPFVPAYLQTLAQQYGAGLRTVDFTSNPEGARQAVNGWVAEQTEGRIRDILSRDAIDEQTRLVLANAIYFKAGWLYPFEESGTRDGQFRLLNGSQVTVPMMHQDLEPLPYARGVGYEAVILPYAGESVEMMVLVPEAGRFAAVEARLNAAFLRRVRAEAGRNAATVSMPRFDFENGLDLASLLPGMGMPNAFDPNTADFRGIVKGGGLYISAAIHRATVAVDEKGTEATAATVIVAGEISAPAEPPPHLTIDRPFIFAIVERETGAILFLGRVTNPAA